jgi:hypothetical protein
LDVGESYQVTFTSTMSLNTANEDIPAFVTLGMFIIDEFSFLNDQGQPTGKTLAPQARLAFLH